jgi:hypothetical protein
MGNQQRRGVGSVEMGEQEKREGQSRQLGSLAPRLLRQCSLGSPAPRRHEPIPALAYCCPTSTDPTPSLL